MLLSLDENSNLDFRLGLGMFVFVGFAYKSNTQATAALGP